MSVTWQPIIAKIQKAGKSSHSLLACITHSGCLNIYKLVQAIFCLNMTLDGFIIYTRHKCHIPHTLHLNWLSVWIWFIQNASPLNGQNFYSIMRDQKCCPSDNIGKCRPNLTKQTTKHWRQLPTIDYSNWFFVHNWRMALWERLKPCIGNC